MIFDSFVPRGLFSEAVLGSPEHVCAGLKGGYVVQHPDVNILRGEHQTPLAGRDRFNEDTPTSPFVTTVTGGILFGGGMECGFYPMGAAAGEAGGLRPGTLDTRGPDWGGDCPPPVRGLISEPPAAHGERGAPHHFVWANWMLKKGGSRRE